MPSLQDQLNSQINNITKFNALIEQSDKAELARVINTLDSTGVPLGIRALCHATYAGRTDLMDALLAFKDVRDQAVRYLHTPDYVYPGSIGDGGLIGNALLANRHRDGHAQIAILNRLLGIPGMRAHVVDMFDTGVSFASLDPAIQHIMKFPEVFAKADSNYHEWYLKVDDFVENYCVSLQAKIAQERKEGRNLAFPADSDEAKLCLLVLRTLMRTYDKRESIRDALHFKYKLALSQSSNDTLIERAKLSFAQWLEKGTNFHAQRISLLSGLLAESKISLTDQDQLLLKNILDNDQPAPSTHWLFTSLCTKKSMKVSTTPESSEPVKAKERTSNPLVCR